MTGIGRLVGKSAIVTGGGSGIGRAVCQLFAKEGASVAIMDIHQEGLNVTLNSLASDHDNTHCTIKTDVSSSEEVKNSVKMAEVQLGQKSSILVNSAGIVRDDFLLKMSEKHFDEVINVNLKGVFLMTKQVIASLLDPYQKDKDIGASIVNLSSIIGKAGNTGQANYAAAKAGLLGMTKTIAQEYGRNNIRCNAILPGFIQTPMTDRVPDDYLRMFVKQIPLRRYGEPHEVANACLFLASEESSYVNGACLEVTGGLLA